MTLYEGCANSGLGRLGVPEVMWTDRPGFSLCAVPLEIVRSCISKWHGQNCGGRMEVWSIPDQREVEKLSEQEETRLSQKLSRKLS